MAQKINKKKVGKYQKNRKKTPANRSEKPVLNVLLALLLAVGCLCSFAAGWYVNTYGDTGFDSIVYTVFSGLGGVQSGLLWSFGLKAVLPAVLCSGALAVLLLFPRGKKLYRKEKQVYPLPRWLARVTALVLSLVLVGQAAVSTGLPEYLYGMFNETPIFETHYVAPSGENVTFPEEKRNLIYIYLESMEISFLSEELGGAMDENLIPELYDLAAENINFSHNDGVGGFLPVNGATWTIGAMVAHTSGVPLKTPSDVDDWQNGYGKDGVFLPGIRSLQDILAEQGYYQSLMVGSVASFGGRSVYYSTHGTDQIYDLSTARRAGIVPSDYFVWWGMEDKYLFEYARQELTEISRQDRPFAFTMLTVDTHHIGGYACEYCGSGREEQYENVMSCSSRQVAEFVQWLKQQPFYENTTIIITGDHLSMDNGYFERNVAESYVRRNYNCFINSAVDTAFSKNRSFSALDMFPTTLAALGCRIEGNRLGLGVNLFSGEPTLIERMGYARFDAQLSLNSEYYAVNFRLEEPEESSP